MAAMSFTQDGEQNLHALRTTTGRLKTSRKIFAIICEYCLQKFDDSMERLVAGIPKFLSVIDQFVLAEKPIEMCLPAFPFKSANKVCKVLGHLPDKAEELALERLNTICARIGDVYSPGAKLTIISDGLVYNGRYRCTLNHAKSRSLIDMGRLIVHTGSRYLGLWRGITGHGCPEGVQPPRIFQTSGPSGLLYP